MQDLTDGVKGLTVNNDLEKSEKERVDIFYAKVKADRDAGTLNTREIVAEAERLEIKSKAPLILAELLFDEKMHVQVIIGIIRPFRRNIIFINKKKSIYIYLLFYFLVKKAPWFIVAFYP